MATRSLEPPGAAVAGDVVDATAAQPEALIEEAREWDRRRRRRRAGALVAGLGVMAAAAGIGYGFIAQGGGGGQLTAASVERSLAASLARSRSLILERTQPLRGGSSVSLVDLETGRSRTTSRTSFLARFMPAPLQYFASSGSYARARGSAFLTFRSTGLDERTHTWRSATTITTLRRLSPVLLCQCDPFAASGAGSAIAVLDRRVTLLARQTLDGQPAVHLRLVWTDVLHMELGGSDRMQIGMDLWLNRATWLPMRITSNSSPVLSGEAGLTSIKRSPTTTTFVWLPRTAANLARLRLVIPPGFRAAPPLEIGRSGAVSIASRGKKAAWLLPGMVTVTSGSENGATWKIGVSEPSAGTMCREFAVGVTVESFGCGSFTYAPQLECIRPYARVGARACITPADRALAVGWWRAPALPRPLLEGTAPRAASVLEIRLSNGSTIRTRVLPAPRGLSPRLSFYATAIPCGAALLSATARTSSGRIVAKWPPFPGASSQHPLRPLC